MEEEVEMDRRGTRGVEKKEKEEEEEKEEVESIGVKAEYHSCIEKVKKRQINEKKVVKKRQINDKVSFN